VSEPQVERRPIGWWLKQADALIEQAFEDAFDGGTINRRQWQVRESLARAPQSEPDLLKTLESFEGAQAAVHELRGLRLLIDGPDGMLTLTHAGVAAHATAAAAVTKVRGAVSAALPAENYPTLSRLLSELVDGLERSRKLSH